MLANKRNEQIWLPSLLNDLFLTDAWSGVANNRAMAYGTNIWEDAAGYHIEIAAPGISKEDVSVQLDEKEALVIRVEKRTTPEAEDTKEDKKYLRREWQYSRFERSFTLPEDVNKEAIAARVNDGILSIDLPKLAPEAQKALTRVIDIQ